MTQWNIARVRTNHELSLAAFLDEETYVPRHKVKIRIRGLKAKRVVAAWQGYLLIRDPGRIDDSRFYHFLMNGDERAMVEDKEVEKYRLQERLGLFQAREELKRLLGIGDAVTVATRAFMGRVGHVLDVRGGRAQLGGDGFPTPMWVEIAKLQPVTP